jgi:hypothetical protein
VPLQKRKPSMDFEVKKIHNMKLKVDGAIIGKKGADHCRPQGPCASHVSHMPLYCFLGLWYSVNWSWSVITMRA